MATISRRGFAQRMAAGAVALSLPMPTSSQTTTGRVPRIGFLIGAGFPTMVAAFKDELRKLGYEDGKNLIVEMLPSSPSLQILKGADAGDLPIQHPPRYLLTVNAATAAAFNLPAEFLATADAVVR